jgi:hypothetical protein
MKHFILLIGFLCIALLNRSVFAQKYTVSGSVNDLKTGEEIIGASVIVKGTTTGVATNSYGFFSLTLDKGNYILVCASIGFQSKEVAIDLSKNTTLNFEIADNNVELKEVEVTAKAKDETMQEKRISVVSMDIATVKSLPAMFGEVDILKSIQLMPGIQSAGEGGAGFNVRGGGTDQNLILLDEATVYNASHLMGFFSVFNSDAIKDIDVYKGGIPAKYGGRLSSLLDIRMRDGNSKHFAASGGIGTISSRLTLEGPIVKDRGSFLVSGRRTYADQFLRFAKKEEVRQNKLYFYDLNLKGNYRINDNNRIFLSGYFGRDVFKLSKLFGFDWGNATGTLRWNHLFGPKLFSNVTAIFSDFNYGISLDFSETQNFKITSGIRDYGMKADFTYYASPAHKLNFGALSTYHFFQPGKVEPQTDESIFKESKLSTKAAFETSVYLDHEWDITSKITLRYGARYTNFDNVGPSTEYLYKADEVTVSDTVLYKKGEHIKTHEGLEPRAALSFSLNEHISIKASYDRTFQFLHQASNSSTTLPTDIWIPSGLYVKPQYSDQEALGYFQEFGKGWEASVETYYKFMHNQIDFKDNASLFFNDRIDRELLVGKGWSYGAEFLIKKNRGNTSGWVAYTWSKTFRQINGINNNEPYPVKNDRRHNISVVLTQKIKERFSLSATWVFQTGNAVTFPSGSYEYDGLIVPYYAERNGYRMPNYHRGDVSFTIDSKKKPGKRFESSWNFSVYNVYNRENAYAIVFRERKDENGKVIPNGGTEAVQISLFKIIPSITWNFKF